MVNLRNTGEYIECFLMIRTKDGQVVPFRINRAQQRLYDAIAKQYQDGKPIRIIILKARQLGFSTFTEAVIFKRTATKKNIKSLVVAHREDSTANLFQMNKLFYEKLPNAVKPMIAASNAQELVFENPDKNPERRAMNPGLNSRIRCNTAGGSGIGRSDTLQNVHASEFAFWRGDKKETWVGIAQAVPALPDTMIIIESTANGFDEFKRMWDKAVAGENDYIPLFFAWFENPEYKMQVPDGTVWTADENKIKEQYGLTDEQMQWRRWCIRNNCADDENKFEQEYPSCPEEAFLTSGNPVFDNKNVIIRKQIAQRPLRVGEFIYDYDGISITNIRFDEKSDGCVRIYSQPNKRRPYVVGGDTAGEGSDWFTGFAIDNITSKQCATLRKQFGEAEYARQMYCLGYYYNWALLGLENNYSTFPTMELARLRYPKLYVRERPDTYTGNLAESYGFVTSRKTRPVILANLVELFRQNPELFVDDDLFDEMLTFVKNEDGRPEAITGEHDDMIMGLAITYGIRNQQRFIEDPEGFSMKSWTPDMIEDYENANDSEKAYLRKVWGMKENDDEG